LTASPRAVVRPTRRFAEMSGPRKFPALCLVAAVAILTNRPVLAADPANGLRIAHRWCEACHVVTPTQTRPAIEAGLSRDAREWRGLVRCRQNRPFLTRPTPKDAGYGAIPLRCRRPRRLYCEPEITSASRNLAAQLASGYFANVAI